MNWRGVLADFCVCLSAWELKKARAHLRRSAFLARLPDKLISKEIDQFEEMKPTGEFVSLESLDHLDELLRPTIAMMVRDHAASERTTPEAIVREAVSAYLGIG